MGLRETVNKNQGLVTAITGGIVVLALGFIIWQYAGGGGGSLTAGQREQFFTSDDGKNFVKDSYTKIAPFTKDGKTFYECRVFECSGKQFVGYLIQYAPDVKSKIEAAIAANNPEGDDPESLKQASMLVKAAGNGDDPKNWKKAASNDGGAASAAVTCPGGTAKAANVFP